MPKFNIQKNTSMNAQESFVKVRNILETDKELHKLDPNYKCNFDEGQLSGHAKGKLFKATLHVFSEDQGSKIEITVDLPLALALAKGAVKRTLENKLEDALS